MLINLDPQLTSIINQPGLSIFLNCHITLIAPATSTTQNFTKKIEKKFFGINVYKIAKEKLSLGFGVSKIQTDTALLELNREISLCL